MNSLIYLIEQQLMIVTKSLHQKKFLRHRLVNDFPNIISDITYLVKDCRPLHRFSGGLR